MPDELTCNCRELKQRRAQFPSPLPVPSPLTRSALKLLHNCSWRGWVVSSVVWEPAQVTLSCKLYILPTFYPSSWPLADCGEATQRTEGAPDVVTDTFCRCGCVGPSIFGRCSHYYCYDYYYHLTLFLSPSRCLRLCLSLSLFVSFPPSVCRLVIFIVMLRIFDRKRMLLLICMSDSGFSAGYGPQPGGKLRYSPHLLFSYFHSFLFSPSFSYSHVSHTHFAKIAKQVPN